MPLINCPECGNECSDQADSCPKCGYPFKKQNSSVANEDSNYVYAQVKVFCLSRKPDKVQKKITKKCKDWEVVSSEYDNVRNALNLGIGCAYKVTVRKKKE